MLPYVSVYGSCPTKNIFKALLNKRSSLYFVFYWKPFELEAYKLVS